MPDLILARVDLYGCVSYLGHIPKPYLHLNPAISLYVACGAATWVPAQENALAFNDLAELKHCYPSYNKTEHLAIFYSDNWSDSQIRLETGYYAKLKELMAGCQG